MNDAIEQVYRQVAEKALSKAEALTLLKQLRRQTVEAGQGPVRHVKPQGITLLDPASVPVVYPPSGPRQVHTLPPLPQEVEGKALTLLQQHLAQPLLAASAGPGDTQTLLANLEQTPAAVAGAPVTVSIDSDVVEMAVYPDGVVLVTLHDRVSRNAFSPGIVAGLYDVFNRLRTTPDSKVLVLTGYEQYFATGGTKEGLIAIQQGTTRYADAPLYELILHCDIPVIAAMQGHGIGAGWAMGMFCD